MDEQRFIAAWRRAGSTQGDEGIGRIYRELEAHYDEPHRRYHTAEHIDFCLGKLDLVPDDYPHKTAVELALWFHDVIYEIGDPENEANSAAWFRSCADGDLPGELVERVCRMIVATEHRQPPARADAAYVVDIDLCSFGRPYAEFLADSRQVRAECTHLTDEQYFQGQCEFLNRLLERDRIYQTDLFHDLYEEQARRNIRRVIDGECT